MSDANATDIDRQATDCVARMLAGVGRERHAAAVELSRLGVQTRGSIRTRGTIRHAARSRLPGPRKPSEVVELLQTKDVEFRCQVLLALGQWGGEEVVAALSQILRSDSTESVQLYCITALRNIGGFSAAIALASAVEHGTDTVRDSAITAIDELANGSPFEDAELVVHGRDQSTLEDEASSARRDGKVTSGHVLTSGTIYRSVANEEVPTEVRTALERAAVAESTSYYARQRLQSVLKEL